MSLDVEYTCPLGSECEKAVNGKLQRCAWFVKLSGKNPQTGELMDQRRCSMAWQPILMIEGNGQNLNVAAAITSLRNETIERQDKALGLVRDEKVITNS